MPAIRDFSQAYHSTNTLKSLLVPMPAYEEGDLLLAVMSADTGSQAWTGLDPITSAQYSDNETFTDYTAAANDPATADIQFLPATPVATEDGLYVGSDVPFAGAYFKFSTQGAGTWTITWQYWNGSSWAALSGVSDGTSNFRAATTTVVATTWTMPTDWATTSKNGITAYYVRGWLTAYTSKTVNPVGSSIFVTRQVNPWRQLFSSTNAANLGVLFKTATAAEVDTTFFYSVAETANGSILSIRDVDGVKDTGWAGNTIAVNATNRTFTRSAGSFATDGFVAGMTVVMTGFTDGGNNTRKVVESVSTSVITVTDGTGLVTESGTGDERIVSSPFNGTTGYATSTTSSAKASMPTLDTVVDDCLLLYLAACSAVGVPSIIEGPATLVFAKDGGSHSDACSWSVLRTAGTSPSTVGYSAMSASATPLAVVALNPPAAGAAAVPGYCVSDASVYLTPFTGAAYNGDAAPANTVTTDFGTVLNGRTLGAADSATGITQADTGVNSYHATARLVGYATAGNYYGLVMRFASGNKPDVSGKNILLHIQPYLPVDIQATDSVALSGAMGVAVGLCSVANTDYKWWHVGGAGTPWGTARHIPVVIHPDNADYIQSTGTLDDTSVYSIGYAVSGRNVVPDWLFGSVWALDTTVVAGGTVAEPLGIPGIVSACATGHERKSVLLQGSSQMLAMQPIQLGDGGTSKLILDLSATAIEFPRLYSKSTKEVSYNSIANEAGLTYYAGANDVITHRDAVVSSASKFHWMVHSSSSAGADYDFSGLQVIGAGTVQLLAGVTFDGISFSRCDEVPAGGATVKNCTFNNTTGTGALQVASAAEMDEVTDCAFVGNAYGIRLTSASAATYTFHGITFSGNTKDVYVSATTGTVTINVEGGGTAVPTYTSAGATVAIVNSVSVSVHCVTGLGADIASARVAVFKTSDMTELMNSLTGAGGVASTTFNYASDTAVVIRARKSGAAPKYLPAEASGTILAGGLSVVLTLLADPNA